jgi:hypothetical protein
MVFKQIIGSIICCSTLMGLNACAPIGMALLRTTPTTDWQVGMPREGQPDFPELGQYWVVDHGCSFTPQKVETADALFEALREDGIAEVAVICQTGILNKGATNNDKIWLRDWARIAKMGDIEEDRAVVWLIRPDVEPQDGKVAIEISRWLYWYTAMDYADGLEEASQYANAGDYDGALVAIARHTNERLRELWINHQPVSEGGS